MYETLYKLSSFTNKNVNEIEHKSIIVYITEKLSYNNFAFFLFFRCLSATLSPNEIEGFRNDSFIIRRILDSDREHHTNRG